MEKKMTRRKADDDVKTKTTPPTPGRRRGRLLQLYAPKLPVVSSAFVFGLFALLAPLLERQYHRLATDGRLVSDVPTVSHELGRFIVKWDKSDLQLKVMHGSKRWCMKDCTSVTAWSTVPGLPFLVAANGPIRVQQFMAGHFRVDITRKLQTTVQTVDAVEYAPPRGKAGKPGFEPGTVVLRGMLIKEDARPDRWMSKYGDLRAAWSELTAQRQKFKAEAKLKANYTLTFTPQSDSRLAFAFQWEDSVPGVLRSPGGRRRAVGLNHVVLRYAADSDERVYGMGEQYSSLEHNGKKLAIITQEQGIGRGKQPVTFTFNRLGGAGGSWHTTYSAIPHYITSKARSLFLTNFSYAEFDFTDDDSVSILSTTPTNTLTGQIIGARGVPEAVESYTEYSGRMQPLPEWTYNGGVILGMTGGSSKVRKVMGLMKGAGVPVAGLWLQDWGGTRNTSIGIERVWWNWELDEDNYPDWNRLREEVRAEGGTRMLTYVNPFLMDARGSKGRLYREAKENGYMVMTMKNDVYRLGSEPGVSFGLLDLTNPAAARWIEDIIYNMAVNTGAAGWMADFGEYLPFDCRLHSGELPIAVHNRYPEDWAALNRRAMRRAGLGSVAEGGNGEGVFWSRSASSQTPRHTPLMWLGDQLVSWDAHDGMKSALLGMLQGGLSGLSMSHSDVGGYTATPGRHRTPELLMRWMELSALADAVFRTHQGNRPLHNAQPWDTPELLEHLAAFAKLHQVLAPYRAELMKESASAGMPLTRPMMFHYAADPVASRCATQFLLGRDILAAPVMDKATPRVHVYLPPGDVWLDVWTTQQAPVQPTGLTVNGGGGGGGGFIGVGGGFGGGGAGGNGGGGGGGGGDGNGVGGGDGGSNSGGGGGGGGGGDGSIGHGVWLTVDAPLGWPAVFIRLGAGRGAREAAAAMREWAVARGGLPPHRRVVPMDPVEKLVLGLYA